MREEGVYARSVVVFAVGPSEFRMSSDGTQARPFGPCVFLVAAAVGSLVAWANWDTPPASGALSQVTSLTTISTGAGFSTGRGTVGLIMGIVVLLAIVAVLTTRGRMRLASAGTAALASLVLLADAVSGLVAGISASNSWGNSSQLGQFASPVQSGIFRGAILPSAGALVAAILGVFAGLYLLPNGIRAAIRDLRVADRSTGQRLDTQADLATEVGITAAQPAPALTPLPPAAWYPDPSTLHAYRWWDGTKWTNHVAPPATAGPATAPSLDAGAQRPHGHTEPHATSGLPRGNKGPEATVPTKYDLAPQPAPGQPVAASPVATSGSAKTTAWLALGISVLIIVLVPMIAVSPAFVFIFLVLALFTALGPKAAREFHGLVANSWKAITWLVVAIALLVGFGVLAGTGVLPGLVTGLVTFILVLLFAIAFWTSVAGLLALPFLGILWALAVISKAILTGLFYLTSGLASGLLVVLSAPSMLFGGRLTRTGKAARTTLPTVTHSLREAVSSYLRLAAGKQPITSISLGGSPRDGI